MATEFDADLDRLADLSDDELNDLEGRITQAFETADDADDDSVMSDLADALDRVRTERDRRSSAPQANPSAPAAEAAAVVPAEVTASADADSGADSAGEPSESGEHKHTEPQQPDSEEPDSDEQQDDDSTDTEAPKGGAVTSDREESTVASGEIEVPAGRAPVVTEPRNVIVAAADIPGYSAGTTFSNYDDVCAAMSARINTLSRLSGGDGEQVIIASVKSPAPEDRMLYANDPKGNDDKVKALTNIDALVAAGGCCAPLTTRYDLFGIGDTDRPVRDALAGFQADRGGIRFFHGPALTDLAGAVGFWTCADDEAALEEDGPRKVCARIECPEEDEAIIQAVTLCITFGVLASRVFPELVARNNQLATVAQARVAESSLLAQIKAGSKAVTAGDAVYGATRDFLLTLSQIAAYQRDRNRLRNDHPMRAILPSWLLDVLRSDLTLNPHSAARIPDNYGISAAEITQFLTDRAINVTWAMDSANPAVNGGGFYAAAGGTIPAFPTSLEFGLFPEGSWLFLDGGTLDLGIVRDSSLIRSNDYMQFSETFEAAANLGPKDNTWWVTQPVEVLGHSACCIDATPPETL